MLSVKGAATDSGNPLISPTLDKTVSLVGWPARPGHLLLILLILLKIGGARSLARSIVLSRRRRSWDVDGSDEWRMAMDRTVLI